MNVKVSSGPESRALSFRNSHSQKKLNGGAFSMDNWTFGITMMICGMGGTILTLYVMSLIMALLGKLFPYKKEEA
jgi:hypothetical protein